MFGGDANRGDLFSRFLAGANPPASAAPPAFPRNAAVGRDADLGRDTDRKDLHQLVRRIERDRAALREMDDAGSRGEAQSSADNGGVRRGKADAALRPDNAARTNVEASQTSEKAAPRETAANSDSGDEEDEGVDFSVARNEEAAATDGCAEDGSAVSRSDGLAAAMMKAAGNDGGNGNGDASSVAVKGMSREELMADLAEAEREAMALLQMMMQRQSMAIAEEGAPEEGAAAEQTEDQGNIVSPAAFLSVKEQAAKIEDPLTEKGDVQADGYGEDFSAWRDAGAAAAAVDVDAGQQQNAGGDNRNSKAEGKLAELLGRFENFPNERASDTARQTLANLAAGNHVPANAIAAALGEGGEAAGHSASGGIAASGGSAVGGAAQQGLHAMPEAARPVGSYDFASQLSAARLARGGAAGLPEAVEQVALHIRKQAGDGSSSMTLLLRPAELGRVEVKLEFMEDGRVQGVVTAENPIALDLLSKDQSSLQRALQDAGLRADAGCLQFNLRGDGQQGQQTGLAQGGNGGGRGGNNDNNNNGNHSLEAGTSDAPSVDGDSVYYLSPGRVNMKV